MSIRRRQKQSESAQSTTELTPEQLEQAGKVLAEKNAAQQQRAEQCTKEISEAVVAISQKYNCQVAFVPGQVQMHVKAN